MKFVYDGPSLPMVEVGNQTIRVQRLVGGQWQTFENEDMYRLLFPELPKEYVPQCPACHCLVTGHHGPNVGCEGAGGNCFCSLTEKQARDLVVAVESKYVPYEVDSTSNWYDRT